MLNTITKSEINTEIEKILMLKTNMKSIHITDIENKIDDNQWFLWKGLLIHKELFKMGVVVIKEDSEIDNQNNANEEQITISKFPLKDRNLGFRLFDTTKNVNSRLTPITDQSASKKAYCLIKGLLPQNSKEPFDINDNIIITNANRREEVFIPTIINKSACYVYPWFSKNKIDLAKKTFLGFDKFVTAGCIFGPGLKGIDQNGYKQPLIKHDIKFSKNQKIVNISFNKTEFSLYEEMLFKELEIMASFIKTFSSENKKSLLYHLPSYDYILFGIDLYIKGRLSFVALDKLTKSIYLRKNQHINKINTIFRNENIEVKIFSPFEFIFKDNEENNTFCAKNFLDILDIKIEDFDSESISEEEIIKNEENLVKICLDRLKKSTEKKSFFSVWEKVLNLTDKKNQKTIDDLFKIANSLIIAMATNGIEDNKT